MAPQETFQEAPRNHVKFSRGNCLIISLTTLSSSPLTLLSDIKAFAWSSRSTEISATLPCSVKCSTFFFHHAILCLCFSIVSSDHIDFSTVSVQFLPPVLPVFRKLTINVQLLQRLSQNSSLAQRQAAFYQVRCSGFSSLSAEYPPFNIPQTSRDSPFPPVPFQLCGVSYLFCRVLSFLLDCLQTIFSKAFFWVHYLLFVFLSCLHLRRVAAIPPTPFFFYVASSFLSFLVTRHTLDSDPTYCSA